MDEAILRRATPDDVAAIGACAEAAYEKYVPRMGRKPAPMVADFAGHVAAGEAFVLMLGDVLAGYIVMMPRADCVFVENVAVDPERQGQGLGDRLMGLAEEEARRHGLPEVSLYSNVKMFENFGFYGRLGFVETERLHEDGFDRVYMMKRLDKV